MYVARDYQQSAIDTAYQRVADGARPIICAATGSGKSVIAGLIAKEAMDAGKRVLFISFREEILDQIFAIFTDICGPGKVGYLMRDKKPWWFYPPVTVASADTLKARWNRSETWRIPAEVVLIDEAHLSLSPKMMQTVMPFYADQTVIGFTATPARRSGLGLGSYYSRIIQVQSVQQLMDAGFLAPCEYWAGSHADTSKIRVDYKTRDFKERELSTAAMEGKLIGDVVDNWLRLASDRHTIGFAVDIAHAQALTERFQAAGVDADLIHSKMLKDARRHVSNQFRAQKLQVLLNVGIAVYGYDVPSINCVVLARPTKSIVMHHQQIGRGIRPNTDGGHTMILDHADNVRRLGCIEDEIRWRLDSGKEAAGNTTRDGDPSRQKKPEAPPTECGNPECRYIMVRTRVCPKCGWEKPVAARDIETIETDLVRYRKAKSAGTPEQKEMRLYYAMAKGWCELNGKNIGAAWHQTKRKFNEEAPWAWRELPSVPPDARVTADMHKATVDYARRQAYGKKRKKKQATA